MVGAMTRGVHQDYQSAPLARLLGERMVLKFWQRTIQNLLNKYGSTKNGLLPLPRRPRCLHLCPAGQSVRSDEAELVSVSQHSSVVTIDMTVVDFYILYKPTAG